ncbi:unnamed protein product [Xylocopa violacea]|uniref:HNH homing endonuclease n=1 Tax=Xylocopa violacea TaxID=135666 RepID=A0ABP1P008_XYLVO
MSEPERTIYVTKYKTVSSPRSEIECRIRRSNRTAKQLGTMNPSRRSYHSCDYQREVQSGSNKINSKLKTLDRRIVRSDYNISTRRDEHDFSDLDDYFHRSSYRKLDSGRGKSKEMKIRERSNEETAENETSKRLKDEESRIRIKGGTIDLERGHVGQKISAYEENAKRGSHWSCDDRYQVFSEVKKHRSIGVPLVGMHNACGLPVVASWHDHELLEPLRINGRVLGTLRPIYKGPRASVDFRRRTHPKRKTPPNQSVSKRSRPSETKESDKKIDYPSIKSLVSLEKGGGEIRKRRRHRGSFKAKKFGTLSLKNSVRRKGKSDERKNKENSLIDRLNRKSLEAGNAKRQTLYARDDGEDAVQVLKSLCLNPLARTKSETDMIW